MIGKFIGNHLTDVAEIESGTALHGVEGYVWCSKHGVVHSDTLNPYAYIEDGKQDYCKPEEHQALFMDSDHNVSPKSEYSGFEAEQFLERSQPQPVRSNPVPLTVRRHTEESRMIWRNNLMDALPQDMISEDRSKIADQLLDVVIEQSDLLRRKRLIDKLMDAAETTEDKAESSARVKTFTYDDLRMLSDLLLDAAEELRSIL